MGLECAFACDGEVCLGYQSQALARLGKQALSLRARSRDLPRESAEAIGIDAMRDDAFRTTPGQSGADSSLLAVRGRNDDRPAGQVEWACHRAMVSLTAK